MIFDPLGEIGCFIVSRVADDLYFVLNKIYWCLLGFSPEQTTGLNTNCVIVFLSFVHVTDPWLQRCKSPVGNPQLIQFSREVVDLMKNQPFCLMSVTKFIPAYHHHFAKQCRVSDYGYSKLLELLEAVPHVLQVQFLKITFFTLQKNH